MTILATDCVSERLERLRMCLTEIFHQAEIITEKDPLMAGKYCFFHHVDIVFADLDNRRMEGMVMEKFVHHSNPEAKFYLTGEMLDFLDWNIIDDEGNPCDEGVSGVISYPITAKKIQTALDMSFAASSTNSGRSIEILYGRLLESEDLQNELLKAASDNALDRFFQLQGCKESAQEIKEYFRVKIADSQELSEGELQMVAGGTAVDRACTNVILKWIKDDS